MKRLSPKIVLVATLLLLPLVIQAAPAKTNVTAKAAKGTNAAPSPESLKSVFVIPKMPKEGRDPFYPKATSLYGSAALPTTPAAAVTSLKLTGILGTQYVTINNISFAVGETQEIKISGVPVSIHVIEIRAQDESVIIEANGQRQELKLGQGSLRK